MTDTDALADALAATLYSELRDAGWSLERLSGELGLSEQTLQRYLTRRERAMPTSVLTRTAALIGVPLAVILRRAEERLEIQADRAADADRPHPETRLS